MKVLVLLTLASLATLGSCNLNAVFTLLGGSSGGLGSVLREDCDPKCGDRMWYCTMSTFRSRCSSTNLLGYIVKSMCSRTCGVCRPCLNIAPRICDPKNDTCVDYDRRCPVLFAPRFCSGHDMSGFVQRKCPKSCHMCKPCSLPAPPVSTCDKDCKDLGDHCKVWEEAGHCAPYDTHYAWMRDNCARTCRVCKPCTYLPGELKSPPYMGRKTSPKVPATAAPRRTTRAPVATRAPVVRKCTLARIVGVSQANQCLNIHNYYRCLHGARPLRYDIALERSAEEYANKLPSFGYLRPSVPGRDRASSVGENLHMKIALNNQYTLSQAVSEWYAEGLTYDYNSDTTDLKSERFTQLIWSSTQRVGCAVRKVDDTFFVVAHYKIKGNIEGRFMDNIQMPIEGTCDAKCLNGTCQGEQLTSSPKCGCDKRIPIYQVPQCGGPCIVTCPRPDTYVGEWETTCTGERVCKCDPKGSPKNGINPGALCS